MPQSLLPDVLKPVLLGFLVGFAIVGITRFAEGPGQPDRAVYVAAPAQAGGAGGHILALR